ncbi:MAG: glycine cleavage T C-terminal barrel domain-containing protein [Candidatus Acidiferrales bacterium]
MGIVHYATEMTAANPLRDVHAKSGAEMSQWFGGELPHRFVGFEREYQWATQSVALLDTNFHAFAWFDGTDRVRYLNAVTTNSITDLAPGSGNAGLLLTAQAHILAELRTYALADRLLVLSHGALWQRTLETLDKFIIMDDVTLDDASARLGTLAIEGPRAAALVHEMCGLKLDPMSLHSHREVQIGSVAARVVRISYFGRPGVEFIAAREHIPALWQMLAAAVRDSSGGPVGYEALNALRLEAGIPWFGYDFDEHAIPHEAALEQTHINYSKGCYTGQEIVERVRARGQVNRRRTALRFSPGAPPPAGTPLTAGGKEVGIVTSAAFSPLTGAPIGFAYIRREHQGLGARLQYEGGTAQVIDLPAFSPSSL